MGENAARPGAEQPRARAAGSMHRSGPIATCWPIWCGGCWKTAPTVPLSTRSSMTRSRPERSPPIPSNGSVTRALACRCRLKSSAQGAPTPRVGTLRTRAIWRPLPMPARPIATPTGRARRCWRWKCRGAKLSRFSTRPIRTTGSAMWCTQPTPMPMPQSPRHRTGKQRQPPSVLRSCAARRIFTKPITPSFSH